ncbi:MAG: hypothetical protein HY427_03710 [Candidatus Levybacteria bacterium]|nr:hypothetical protein [Candidatus Levybacteria bacterium]
MEFKAQIIDGKIEVKAIAERLPNGDLIMHVPSFTLISDLKKKYEEEQKDGKRAIQ